MFIALPEKISGKKRHTRAHNEKKRDAHQPKIKGEGNEGKVYSCQGLAPKVISKRNLVGFMQC